MINWYLKVVRDNYLNFNGRARRSEYWYFTLCNTIILALLIFLGLFTDIGLIPYVLYALAVFLPGIAVAVRRLHDTGKSGAFLLLSLLPLLNIWVLIVLLTEGDRGPNMYGPDPKEQYGDLNEIGKPETY